MAGYNAYLRGLCNAHSGTLRQALDLLFTIYIYTILRHELKDVQDDSYAPLLNSSPSDILNGTEKAMRPISV